MKALALILFAFPAFAGEPAQLITAARTQVGVTVVYDPAYVSLAFPGGDVDQSRGVCTDVVIRAMRTSWGIDPASSGEPRYEAGVFGLSENLGDEDR